MTTLTHGYVIVFACFLGLAGDALGVDGKQAQSPPAARPGLKPGWEEIARRSAAMAEEAQAGLKRSLEQTEQLQRLLDQTRLELLQLREEVSQLRSDLAGRQPLIAAVAPAVNAGEPAADPVQAAEPGAASPDLNSRLDRLEDKVEVNSSQIREQAQTKVESDSRFGVRLFGTLLFNSFFNTADAADQAAPLAAPAPPTRVANGGDNFGSTLRQTSFGFAMAGPTVGDARLSAEVEFDFYGGTPGVYGTDALGALRMRTASARLDGPRTSLAMGLMAPMISPLNPTSLAAVFYPALGESGNLWQWLPQTIAEHRAPINESSDLILQAGLMAPFGENFYGKGLAGRPGYESRLAYSRRLDADRRLEAGAGGYVHPQPFGFDRTVNSYAVTGDWLIPIGRRLELSGEAYYGQSITLKVPGGGNVSDMFAFTGPVDNPATRFSGIRSAGGWAQLCAQATPRLEFNAAFGADDPRNSDVFGGLFKDTSRLRNEALTVNSIYRLRSNFLVSFEYRRLWTDYPAARTTNGHFNLALAYLF